MLIFDRDVSSFDECDWLCATLVLLCEWSRFLKQPLFGDEAGFSAAVIGAFLSSLSRGIVFRVVHLDENFQLFYGRTNVNLADVCLASTLLMQSAHFPVLNLLRLQRKKNISPFFFLSYLLLLEKTVIKSEFGKFFSSVE